MLRYYTTVNVVIFLISFLFINQTCQSLSLNSLERNPLIIKRSLCNTFTGCGAKRSLQAQQQLPSAYELTGASAMTNIPDLSERLRDPTIQSKKETNANLVAEILKDLTEYLRSNEKYNQGKYVVLVSTKQITDNSQLNPASFAVIGSGGQLQQVNPSDLQEIQLGRVYLNKNNEQN